MPAEEMYKVKPFYDSTEKIELPNVMYKVKSFHGDSDQITEQTSKKYRCYSPLAMRTALERVRQDGLPIRTAAREFGVPEASLRHKLSGRVPADATRSGPPPVFTIEEEAHFVNHIKFMVSCGYGYSRPEVVCMASDYAVSLMKRDVEHPLTFRWYTGFMTRWPELKLLKPRGLNIQRARATSSECVGNYYTELGAILSKYKLEDRPERMYSLDENMICIQHKQPSVVSKNGSKILEVPTGTGTTVTIIGCGNAVGCSVPPFLIFPGKRIQQNLLEGKTPGADACVSESGCSSSTILKKYINEHLTRYLPERSADNPVLLLYDGHKSHINLGLIDWARSLHIILLIMPAHTSHVLQPQDCSCFGPFQKIYDKVSEKFMREHCGQVITRYNVCHLACSAYSRGFSPANLQTFFRKAGIHPLNPNAINASNFKPSSVIKKVHTEGKSDQIPSTSGITAIDSASSSESCDIEYDIQKQQANKLGYHETSVSREATTETNLLQVIEDYESARGLKKAIVSKPLPQSQSCTSPSGPLENTPDLNVDVDSSSEDTGDRDLCCVCGLFTPEKVHHSTTQLFVKWVQCSSCSHWVHLSNCTNVKVVKRGDVFMCPHCM